MAFDIKFLSYLLLQTSYENTEVFASSLVTVTVPLSTVLKLVGCKNKANSRFG